MPVFAATLGSVTTSLSSLSQLFSTADASSHSHSHSHSHPRPSSFIFHSSSSPKSHLKCPLRTLTTPFRTLKVSVSGTNTDNGVAEAEAEAEAEVEAEEPSPTPPLVDLTQARRSADWKAARAYNDSGLIYEGRIAGSNNGGLLIRFYSLRGFLPFSQLSPSHSCKEPHKPVREIAENLTGSRICVKVTEADEEKRRLIFSEKEAVWSKFSNQISIGDIFEARVGCVEDYGAFVNLRFPDGLYHVAGMVHVSEVSWDLVQDVRDVLSVGDDVRVKVIGIDKKKLRITLSIKQLEEDPLLQTLDKVIPENGSASSDTLSSNDSSDIEPLPGLQTIIDELLLEDGIDDVRISRQGFEKRVVSQDLQLWLSSAPPINKQFTLLARAGRQVQEILLLTLLDQEGIKKALQRVLERVP